MLQDRKSSDFNIRTVFCTTALATSIALLYMLNAPILDSFGFRQAQTAITTRWLFENGPSLIYGTPVLGYPWAIPFEFPIYQNIVALIARLGLPLEVSGRLVSIAFFLGLLPAVYLTYRTLGVPAKLTLGVLTIVLASPLYIFWSRTFMIESAALFFSFWWLAALVKTLDGASPRWLWIAVAVSAGSLAALTKATTLPAFCVAGCLIAFFYFAWPQLVAGFSRERLMRAAVPLLLALVVASLPLIVGMAWVAVSDPVKATNPFGSALTSGALQRWNFGTLEQRLGGLFWLNVVSVRTGFETFGYALFAAPVVLAAAYIHQETRVHAFVATLACLTSFLVFTNLHYVHNYYPYANAIFAVIAFAFGLWALSKLVPWLRFEFLIGVTVVAQLAFYVHHFVPLVAADQKRTDDYRIAEAVRELTPPDSMLLVFGRDWSSEIPFYAQRYSLAVPGWADAETLRTTFTDLGQSTGGLALGGMVVCGLIESLPGVQSRHAADLLHGAALLAEAGSCRLFWVDTPYSTVQPNRTISPSLLTLLQSAEVEEAPNGLSTAAEGLFAHPPSSLILSGPLPRRIEGSVGFLSATPLDMAAVFVAEIVAEDGSGSPEVLVSLRLDPQVVRHEPQRFSFEAPEDTRLLRFSLRPAGDSLNYGWLYWAN